MTQDIGYHVDFLAADKLEEIRNAKPADLTRAISALAWHLEDFAPNGQTRLIDRDVDRQLGSATRITALLRGLCDEVDKRFTR
jgi:hypothetical protein